MLTALLEGLLDLILLAWGGPKPPKDVAPPPQPPTASVPMVPPPTRR